MSIALAQDVKKVVKNVPLAWILLTLAQHIIFVSPGTHSRFAMAATHCGLPKQLPQ
jgi:hypothetical protein